MAEHYRGKRIMNERKDILEAWIIEEILSEGSINPNQKQFVKKESGTWLEAFDNARNIAVQKQQSNPSKYAYNVLYVDLFPFTEVESVLRDKLGMEKKETDDANIDDYRFGLALVFDRDLQFDKEDTFVTMSSYIRRKQVIPDVDTFRKDEEEFKIKCEQLFDRCDSDDQMCEAISKIVDEYSGDEDNCRACYYTSHTELTNLHSFFIDDLQKAKTGHSANLAAYLAGHAENAPRINLDTRDEKQQVNFGRILAPERYPIARFPDNPDFALSFMQQTAVNLAIGQPGSAMLSVNGPPGTGKTTLLRDIFAELIAEQAHEMAVMKHRKLPTGIVAVQAGAPYNFAPLPSAIADRGIVVASSNNSAVRNIVDELPQITKIHDMFRKELQEADYFFDTANEIDPLAEPDEKENTSKNARYWGLFSLEGGRSANIKNLLNKVGLAWNELSISYTSDPGVYDQFLEAENEIKKLQRNVRSGHLEPDASPLSMKLPYEELQKSNPWYGKKYRVAQSRLFICALKVRKQFLFENREILKTAKYIFDNRHSGKWSESPELIPQAFSWLNLCVPVISSTFASFGRMCHEMPENSIGHLFVDEAGQAVPQAAVGAIARAKHVMVVGDPAQITPVVSLNPGILSLLGKRFHVDDRFISDTASVQTLVDDVSPYGFYKTKSAWIGIPLWVHRRCADPMFSISNELSYNNLMVQGNPEEKSLGRAGWFDVGGRARDKYVAEQSEFLKQLISTMAKDHPNILNPNAGDEVFVISPFRNVAYRLKKDLKSIGFYRRDHDIVGTIHTFQGKEAPIVFLVLGADERSTGAATWAVSTPNMINVAATRARKAFYIIGDRKLYMGLGSEVVMTTLRCLQQYRKKYPDLVVFEDPNQSRKKVSESGEKLHRSEETAGQSEIRQNRPEVKQQENSEGRRMNGISLGIRVARTSGMQYATIKGSDDINYYLPNTELMKIPDYQKLLEKDAPVTFIPDARKGRNGEKSFVAMGVQPVSGKTETAADRGARLHGVSLGLFNNKKGEVYSKIMGDNKVQYIVFHRTFEETQDAMTVLAKDKKVTFEAGEWKSMKFAGKIRADE